MPSKVGYFFEKFFIEILKKILGSHVDGVLVNSKNGALVVDLEDQIVGRKLRRIGAYGIEEIDRLKTLVSLDSKVLIVGAHIGSLVIPISKVCKEIVAFEANPITYKYLEKNVALNCNSNCRTYNLAAGEKKEEIRFLLNRSNSGGSKRVPKKNIAAYSYDSPEEIMVKSVNLDMFLESEEFDVIIMDIEGSEYFALKGMQRILTGANALAVEFEPHHLTNVSGVTIEEFLQPISSHFSTLTIPSKNITVDREKIVKVLTEMYIDNQKDGSIVFQK